MSFRQKGEKLNFGFAQTPVLCVIFVNWSGSELLSLTASDVQNALDISNGLRRLCCRAAANFAAGNTRATPRVSALARSRPDNGGIQW